MVTVTSLDFVKNPYFDFDFFFRPLIITDVLALFFLIDNVFLLLVVDTGLILLLGLRDRHCHSNWILEKKTQFSASFFLNFFFFFLKILFSVRLMMPKMLDFGGKQIFVENPILGHFFIIFFKIFAFMMRIISCLLCLGQE